MTSIPGILLVLIAFAASAEPIAPDTLRVVDGDTVEHRAIVYRVVGLDAPETSRAKRSAERALGNQAAARLRELVAGGDVDSFSGALLMPGRH